MISQVKLAELHVRAYVSRQKRQDEIRDEECAKFDHDCKRRKAAAADAWRQQAINCAGPLGLLDAVGQAEESWLELFENAPRCVLPRTDVDDATLVRRLDPRTA